MNRLLLGYFLLLLTWSPTQAQMLQTFIDAGLKSNSYLAAKSHSYTVALHALDEAKKLRSIKLDFLPTYTWAAGGRTINVPIGDLLNPVYSSLNNLTASNQFPQVENVSELLNPSNFYDIKVRASYPVLNQAIGVQQEIKSIEVLIADHEVELYRQRLNADIATAYYDCQLSQRALDIYAETMVLVTENIRVNQGLLDNGKGLPIDVLAAQNDAIQLSAAIANAQLDAKNAAAYLNFLCNRPLSTPVLIQENLDILPSVPLTSQAGTRQEILQLSALSSINERIQQLTKAQTGPQLNIFIDAGIQNFNFNIDRQSPYMIAGVSFNMNLLDGGQTKAKMATAEAKVRQIQQEKIAVQQEIELEIFSIRQKIEQTFNQYEAQQKEIDFRQQRYEEQLNRYSHGIANYIDIQLALNEWTKAKLEQNITLYQAYKLVATYKRSLAIQ